MGIAIAPQRKIWPIQSLTAPVNWPLLGDKLLKNNTSEPSTNATPRMSNLLSSDNPSLWTLGALLVRGLAAVFLSLFCPNDGTKRDRIPPSALAVPLLAAGAAP